MRVGGWGGVRGVEDEGGGVKDHDLDHDRDKGQLTAGRCQHCL